MKIIKGLLFTLGGIIGLIFLIALFIDGEYKVEREVNISKPKQEVFSFLTFLKNQDMFSVWNTRDPEMKREFRGTDGTVGAVSAWDSQKDEVGAGEQEIKNITDGERIDFELRFTRPFEATDQAYFTTESMDTTQTRVVWGFSGKMTYPKNVMMLFMDMDQMLGPDLQTGLDNLKTHLEKPL